MSDRKGGQAAITEKIAIAVFIVMFVIAVWINPGEVLPYTLQVILWCLVGFFAIILLLGSSRHRRLDT